MLSDSVLEQSFKDLDDALDDFRNAPYRSEHPILKRFVALFDTEPLAGFIKAVLPKADSTAWLEHAKQSDGGMRGSAKLDWPAERELRVALQIDLVRKLAQNDAQL